MKKFGFLVAAVIAAGIVAPSMASAETIIIKRGGHHGGPRAEMMRHRDHGFRHHDRKVIIVKHRH
jgi:hypothetical protein